MAGVLRDRRILLGLALALLSTVVIATAISRNTGGDAEAAGGGPEMALSLASYGVCPNPNECTVTPGYSFVVSIDAVTLPANGFIGVAGWLDYGDDLGDQNANGAVKDNQVIWPDCYPPLFLTNNTDEGGTSNLDSLSIGCLTAVLPPYPVSTYTGSLFTVELTCPSSIGDHVIDLLSYGEQPAGSAGAAFSDDNGTIVPAKAGSLTIHCAYVTDTPVPSPGNGPDLVIKEMKIELETGADCDYPSTNLGVSIRFSNSGNEPAGAFTVEVNGDQQSVPGGLGIGEDQTLWFKGYEQFSNNVGTVDVLGEVAESNEANNTVSTPLGIPTLPPTCTPTPKPPDGDTDGDATPNSLDPDDDNDGCPDVNELGSDPMQGGLRNPHDPWDYYDVAIAGAAPGHDGVIDLPNDILGVILHYSPTGASPYDIQFDRGPQVGTNVWNMGPPDGFIDLPNDILGVILQFGHNCV